MKYTITKTSDWWGENQPCEKAYKGELDDVAGQTWYVDITTIEELHQLIEEVKHSIIVSKENIEIYDDYRE